ncbi:Receptor-like protein EIX2 [Linum perenne]
MRFCCYGAYAAGCNQVEREALLEFKVDFQDPSSRLSSWVNGSTDCCKWPGVVCDNVTGHVTQLRLQCPYFRIQEYMLKGKLNPSLLELKHLSYLDLSGNDFQGIPIPRFLGSMTSLKYLFLDGSGFGAVIPHQLGNLSNLVELSLRAGGGDYVLYADSLQWLSGLPALEYLDLSGVDLSSASDWLNMINAVPSLSELYLKSCQISGDFPLVHVNMSSLSVLDLGFNRFGPTSFPSWVSHLKSLTSLDLQANRFGGPIPDGLQNLTSLRALKLSLNKFNGSIPNWLFSLRHLEDLDIHQCKFDGDVSIGFGNLTSLINLDLSLSSGLKFVGGIPSSFRSFCHLNSLKLSHIKLQQSVSEVLQILEECSSSTLEFLSLDGCQLFGQLTDRIGKFKRLYSLNLNDNSISGPLPMSFGELASLNSVNLARNQINGTIPASFGRIAELEVVDISHNLLEGIVSSEIHFANLKNLNTFKAAGNRIVLKAKSDWVPPKRLSILDLSSWYIGPGFPKWLLQSVQHLKSLDLSNSGIAESIPDWFLGSQPEFYYLNLSHNQISGMLPSYISVISSDSMFDFSWNNLEGPLPLISSNLTAFDLSNNFVSGNLVKFLCSYPAQMMDIEFLNLQGNLLSGEIPDCWRTWGKLKVLRLGSNKLRGSIPISIGTLSSLLSLRIQNNSLTGDIPLSLGNCSSLVSIDLSYNGFEGNIPKWIGERLTRLSIITLRGNKFWGIVPEELCHLQLLQILDLSHNFLYGNMPECVANFTAMTNLRYEKQGVIYLFFGGAKSFVEYQVLVAQGQIKAYSTILNYVRSLDLSCNNFSGEIPKQITALVALKYLNLSHNSLSGAIPGDLADMESLESLDLSENKLSGVIPARIASLTFLNHLNLSYNSLSGRIPSSTQLQSFDISSFIGNPGLCGSPLTVNCSTMNTVPGSGKGNKDYDFNGFSEIWKHESMAGLNKGNCCESSVELKSVQTRSAIADKFQFFKNQLDHLKLGPKVLMDGVALARRSDDFSIFKVVIERRLCSFLVGELRKRSSIQLSNIAISTTFHEIKNEFIRMYLHSAAAGG